MIVTGGRFQLVSVLVTLALLVRIKISTASSDLKLGIPSNIENVQDDSEIKKGTSSFEKQKLIRVPLKLWNPRNRERRSIGTADRTANENERHWYRGKFDGNTIALNEKPSRDDSVFKNEFKIAKKNYAKFKLARVQAGYNNPKDKVHSRNQDLEKYMDTYLTKKIIVRRRVDYIVKEDSIDSQNQINERYAKRNLTIRNDDYYAQRRSVMERFYARQREIANKYRNKTSTTSEHNDRFDLGLVIRTNNVSSLDKIEQKNIFKPISVVNNVNDKIDAREYVNNTTEPEMHPRRVRTENNRHRNHSSVNVGYNEEEYEYYDEYEDEISNNTNNEDTRIPKNTSVTLNDNENNGNENNGNKNNGNTVNGNENNGNENNGNTLTDNENNGNTLTDNENNGNTLTDTENNGNTLTDNENNGNTLADTENNGNTLTDNENNSNTLNDRNSTTMVAKNNSTNWSNCTKGVGKLLYQYNTLLRVTKTKSDIGVSIDGPFCITCVEVIPSVGTKAIISYEVIGAGNGALQTVKIMIRGIQNESVSLTVKIWAVPRTSEGCTGN